MDHLILPEGARHWILVSYSAKEDQYYENLGTGFHEHPKRAGWADDETLIQPKEGENYLGGTVVGEEDKSRTDEEIERFFQTWLFFGLLIEVFSLSGIHVTTKDFLVPRSQDDQTAHVVTTSKLPSLIIQWREKHEVSGDSHVFDAISKILDRVGVVLDHHCASGKNHRSIHQYGPVLWPVGEEITTSIIAVAATLRKAARLIYNQKGKAEKWPVTNSRILHLRIQRKWCKSDAAMMMEDFDIDGQYFIAAAESHSLDSLDRHWTCTDNSCEAKVSDGTYATRHADGCAGDDYNAEPNFVGHVHPAYGNSPSSFREGLKNIMDRRHLPFVRWDFEQKGLATFGHVKNSYSEDSSKTPPYVAISHVWANGMGNPFHNSLPICQLEKVQKLVDDLCDNHLSQKKGNERAGFWMDTLCCMVGKDAESKEYKKKSINSMRDIYREAAAVLIIDPWLMSLPSTAPMSQICHRIYASGWSRRLWTHQEGFLGKDVYYQLQDGALSLPTIDARAQEYQRVLMGKGYAIGFPYEASGKTSSYYTLIKSLIGGITEGHFSKDNIWIAYQHLAESLGYRSTTNIDDELLCVASVIGLDVEPYLKIDDKTHKTREQKAEKRMQMFLEEVGRFRQGIIFNNYSRLTIPGFRWAPRSLLGHRTSGLGDLEGSQDSKIQDFSSLPLDDKHAEIVGVKVNVSKFMTKSLGLNARFVSLVLNNKDVKFPTVGLPVDYPGYTIKFLSGKHGLTINMAERRFCVRYSPISSTIAMLRAPPLPKVSSFGKVPTLGKMGSLGKVPQVEKAPVVDKVAEVVSYDYIVYVAENGVRWKRDASYALILQKPLGGVGPREFLAMIGLTSVGPGTRTWTQSLCSAIVREVQPTDSYKLTAGLDVVDVAEARNDWVIT